MRNETFLRPVRLYGILAGCLGITTVLSLLFGSAVFSPRELWRAFVGEPGYETCRFILFSLRFPRLFAACIAGVGLSLSGVLLQNIMGNPLASPNTIGVNAGAGLTVVLALTVFPTAILLLPFAAFSGAFGTSLFILAVSRKAGGGKGTVVLAGVACTTLFQALISFLSTLDTDVLSLYTSFSIGSLQGVTTEQILLPGALVLLCLAAALLLSGRIAVLSLGDGIAASLGVRVTRMRTVCLLLASMSAAAVISYAGLLGFVGLVVPHMTRKLIGHDVRHQLGVSALLGALLVMLADLAGRVLFSPSEISVGILMSLIGAPFFFILLLKRKEFPDADH
ncbi:MAG: iron ABC transporter permease [Ruminococcaceae bacterium]|nr:iron ABC transporter permease [Oscillospiraceae bacterium]